MQKQNSTVRSPATLIQQETNTETKLSTRGLLTTIDGDSNDRRNENDA